MLVFNLLCLWWIKLATNLALWQPCIKLAFGIKYICECSDFMASIMIAEFLLLHENTFPRKYCHRRSNPNLNHDVNLVTKTVVVTIWLYYSMSVLFVADCYMHNCTWHLFWIVGKVIPWAVAIARLIDSNFMLCCDWTAGSLCSWIIIKPCFQISDCKKYLNLALEI